MAKDYLAIMATSAPVESIFSEFSNIITKNRNSLSDEVAIKTMLLKNWKLSDITMDESEVDELLSHQFHKTANEGELNEDENEGENDSELEIFD